MSDLDEIAAAAGITIVDTHAENDENTDNVNESSSDNSCLTKQIHEWDDMFSNRYTMSDTEYATTVETADILNRPPCLTGFNCFRQRDDSRNWNRDRRHNDGDRGRYRGNSWNRHGRNDGGGWNRDRDDGRSHHNLQSHGDYHHRGYEINRAQVTTGEVTVTKTEEITGITKTEETITIKMLEMIVEIINIEDMRSKR
uniref:Uncharacterized protein n=1 Tax=Arion vulgaris TaxID=1028688 RepID=A0A0B7AF51_9EUPU